MHAYLGLTADWMEFGSLPTEWPFSPQTYGYGWWVVGLMVKQDSNGCLGCATTCGQIIQRIVPLRAKPLKAGGAQKCPDKYILEYIYIVFNRHESHLMGT